MCYSNEAARDEGWGEDEASPEVSASKRFDASRAATLIGRGGSQLFRFRWKRDSGLTYRLVRMILEPLFSLAFPCEISQPHGSNDA